MTNASAVPAPGAPASPQVSVIIPAFNAGAYLGDALASMRAQTIADIEIIVIDDGSSDDTLTVARAHAAADPRVRVIARGVPSGRPAVARNEGLRVARGQYIALLDADDTSSPTRLARAIDAMRTTGARFAFTDLQRRYQDTGALAPQGTLAAAAFTDAAAAYLTRVSETLFLCSPMFSAFLLTYIAINTSTVTFDRSLLAGETTWFDETIVRFEDVDFWFRLAEHTQLAYVAEVQTIMRKHSRSITASDPVSTRVDGILVRAKHLARLRPRLSSAEISAAKRNIGALQFHVAYAQWCAGQDASARHWFLESWRSHSTAATLVSYLKAFIPRARIPGLASAAAATEKG